MSQVHNLMIYEALANAATEYPKAYNAKKLNYTGTVLNSVDFYMNSLKVFSHVLTYDGVSGLLINWNLIIY